MKYSIWIDDNSIICTASEGSAQYLTSEAKLISTFDADTWEEACAIYHLRLGFEPYVPQGKAVKCPNKCGVYFYPEGSGTCPHCGDI